jgi:hypothetical protein
MTMRIFHLRRAVLALLRGISVETPARICKSTGVCRFLTLSGDERWGVSRLVPPPGVGEQRVVG